MRLSRLHIAGFKSFCDRSELGFDDGVTAIVGPNGCGKSNVVDAITWVLGEQSAKSLRGDRMEDVLFNGSDARKPTATAEVRLKLTNVLPQIPVPAAPVELLEDADGDGQPALVRDVEIGRRLYRSGESEYLIDGEICRLRDVHDLLMDSGLGVKAYAVIEQGKIGQILSSRPAERRMLIEEAAGVTKYKSRRRAAELKLEAAEQNLTRVDDVIFEVEKQRSALKRQAARARRYRRLREELRKWEQVQIARRHEALGQQIESALRELEATRVRETLAAAHVAELETVLAGLRSTLAEAEAGVTAAREDAHARELAAAAREQQIAFDRRQIDDLARQADAFSAEARDLEARRGPAAAAIATQRQASLAAREALERVRGELAARESDYAAALSRVQHIEQEADETRAAVLASSTTLSALRQARDHASGGRDRIAAELERFDIESRELAAEAGRAEVHQWEAAAALVTARTELDRLLRERAGLEARLVVVRDERQRATESRASAERELAGTTARLRSLQEIDASRATFGDAARYLLAEAADRLHQHGAIADHVSVERSYERAVDVLLGDLLEHIVVDRLDDALSGLRLLADRDGGTCGFVILDRVGIGADALTEVPEGARRLSDIATATGPHAAAIARVLPAALIVRTFEEAQALADRVAVPVAASTGEVFEGRSIVRGGARRDARGILEVRAEMLSLGDEVERLNERLAFLAADFDARDARVGDTEAALAETSARQHEHEKAIIGQEAQASRAADEQARISRRLDVVRTEHARAVEAQAEAERRRDEATETIAVHEAQQREAEASLGGVLERLQRGREAADDLVRVVTAGRTEQATLAERQVSLEADVLRLEEAAADLDRRLVARANDIRGTEDRRAALGSGIAEAEQQLDADVRALDGLKARVRELDDRTATSRAEFTTRDQALKTARHALDAVRGEVTTAEVARAQAAADLAHLSQTCLDTIGRPLAEVLDTVASLAASGALVIDRAATPTGEADGSEGADDAGDEGTAAEESAAASGAEGPDEMVALFRGKIDRLGPVNMMAIEQFDELETRHAFLTTQRADLLTSIAQTGEAIRKIDKTTRERFAEAFASINTHFERTFTTLFGGGRAGLVLIDQENDPESGVDIIAQPPGKRLQNVQLLSGGEKALTAMALMFAIFKHRPSPFCLLDEIDAPLDDANIGRFVDMLRGMQGHTQFILITHNRKTMEIANRLYGVTMEEPGVSKLISLQLN